MSGIALIAHDASRKISNAISGGILDTRVQRRASRLCSPFEWTSARPQVSTRLHGASAHQGIDVMNSISHSRTESQSRVTLNAKLRAALEYLGDKLCTHPASRYKPSRRSLLDEWRAARRLELEQA